MYLYIEVIRVTFSIKNSLFFLNQAYLYLNILLFLIDLYLSIFFF